MSKLTTKKSIRLPQAKFKPDSSVLLKRVSGVELRLTPMNRLFVIFNKQVAWPYMKGLSACLDIDLVIPEAALKACGEILEKQERIRREHPEDFEDDNEDAYTFN